MTNLVWRFPDLQSRNAVGRAVRLEGYECHGTGPTASDRACLLTITETDHARRAAVARLVHGLTHHDSGPTGL